MIKPVKIGNITLKNNLILAPMAGFSDVGLRSLASFFGAGLTVTEMVSAKALFYKNIKTAELLIKGESKEPISAQIFGSQPDVMAQMVAQSPLTDFEIIDINMGCPTPKITKNGEGSALLQNPALAAQIVESCVLAANGRPVTVKIRSGYDEVNCATIASACERAGAAAITLHARTRAQGYSGLANREHFKLVKNALKSIPLIANGDICTINDISQIYNQSGADAFMIGRAALGNPQIFAHLLGNNVELGLFEIIKMHFDILCAHFPSRFVALVMRAQVAHYLRGVRGGKELKQKIFTLCSPQDMIELLRANL